MGTSTLKPVLLLGVVCLLPAVEAKAQGLGNLPTTFAKAFALPTAEKDQHGNPVVKRDGSRSDPGTGYPLEIWLGEPRMELVFVPAGDFMMGSPETEVGRLPNEGPVHPVRITKPFYIGKYEVTNAQYRTLKAKHDTGPGLNDDRQPAAKVSWYDATAFCTWLQTRSGMTVRLPTDAEWEYACRAGATTAFYWGDELDPRFCNFSDRSARRPNRRDDLNDGYPMSSPVGRFRPNDWGLYDLLGNVYEWCQDGNRTFTADPQVDPCGPDSESRVLRGGSWAGSSGGPPPRHVRCANRGSHAAKNQDPRIGFRVCVPLEMEAKAPATAAPLVEFSLKVDPPHTAVKVDGKAMVFRDGAQRISIDVKPGRHYVEVTKAGLLPLRAAVDVEPNGFAGRATLAKTVQQVTVHLKSGTTMQGILLSRTAKGVTLQQGKAKVGLTAAMYDRVEVTGEVGIGESVLQRVGMPYSLSRAFVVPKATHDQYGNAVSKREGDAFDPGTGYPCEIWLKEPRVEFVLIPPGEFMMGGQDRVEKPAHRVQISRAFYLAKYELTQAQWQRVMGTNPWARNSNVLSHPRHPAVCISRHDADELVVRLNQMVGVSGFRLPTEAEWERACRAGSTTKFYFGDDESRLKEYAWHGSNSGGRAHAVGGLKSNAWGLYDMHGNVWEWVYDYQGSYASGLQIDPRGPSRGRTRVGRGGSFNNTPTYCRSGDRHFASGSGYDYLGVVKS